MQLCFLKKVLRSLLEGTDVYSSVLGKTGAQKPSALQTPWITESQNGRGWKGPLLGVKAGRAGAVQPGEDQAPGRPYCSLSVLKAGLQQRWGQGF